LPSRWTFSVTENEVNEWDREAETIIREMSAFLERPPASMLLPIDTRSVDKMTKEMRERGMDAVVLESIKKLQWRGAPKEVIAARLAAFPLIHKLLDMLENGQRCFMKETFKPNGGLGFRQSTSYKSGVDACNTALNTLAQEGRVLQFWANDIPPDTMRRIHINPLLRAPKAGNPLGRACLNLSKGGRNKTPSVNEGTDKFMSDEAYPEPRLPTLRSISELIVLMQDAYPGEDLEGATADAKQAYCQNVASLESALLRCTRMFSEDRSREILAMYIVCIFGDTRAGHVYGLASGAIDFGHNEGHSVKRSATYVDDGILFGPRRLLPGWLAEYLDWIRLLYGNGAIAQEKVSSLSQDLVAIGWHWNLRRNVWRVGPKKRGLLKMYIAVFCMIKPEDTRADVVRLIPRKILLHVGSLLMWYSAVIPMGGSFVLSILRSAGRDGHGSQLCLLSEQAKSDVDLWRVIIISALNDGRTMRVPIDLIAEGRRPDFLLQTDASTSIGGGGWLAEWDSNESIIREAVIRWTPQELAAFAECESGAVGINILEFFTAAILLITWSDLFKNKKVMIRVDNTAAMKWVRSQRFPAGSSWLDEFMNIFSIHCALNNIFIVSEHVPGFLNVHADFLSRDVDLQEGWTMGITGDELRSQVSSRGAICRALFNDSVHRHNRAPLARVLRQVERLQETLGTGSV
jgi:hypothetical protein